MNHQTLAKLKFRQSIELGQSGWFQHQMTQVQNKALVNLFIDISFSVIGLKRQTQRKGSPGLVVMGGDSYSKGCGFESGYCILEGHFFTYVFVVKFILCLKKRGRGWPIL